MERRRVLGFSLVYLVLFVVSGVKGTLTPNGPLSLDCGSQQTFTCSVNGTAAGWTITGLIGITALGSSGMVAGDNNARIINTDTGDPLTSTITITGFNTSDNGVVQCIELVSGAVQGMTAVSVGSNLSAPNNLMATTDSCQVTLQWNKPSAPADVGNSVSCNPPSAGCNSCKTSPCNISSLDPDTAYQLTVTLTSAMCNSSMSTVMAMTGKTPGCPEIIYVRTFPGEECPTILWKKTTNAPVTALRIMYTPEDGSGLSECETDDLNCTINGLRSNTEYTVTITAVNNCGDSPEMGCPRNRRMFNTNETNCVSVTQQSQVDFAIAIGGGIGGFLLVVIIIITVVVIVVVCYCCPRARSACCCCVSGGSKRSTSTEPMKPRPGEEYADPQKVRASKESGKQGITYAALEFSEQAGSTGGQKVRSKGEAVQYMAVEHA